MIETVGILDYTHAGNIYNIVKALSNFNVNIIIIKNNEDFKKINRLIIPGVGTYQGGMRNILHLKESIIEFSTRGYILGICLGMQLLSTTGKEYGFSQGLNLISGDVVKMHTGNILPHIGWNKLNLVKNSEILKGCESGYFYFMHSYEFVNFENISSLCSYKNHQFVSSIEKDNIFGVQFHPEKSRETGLQLLKNFIEITI